MGVCEYYGRGLKKGAVGYNEATWGCCNKMHKWDRFKRSIICTDDNCHGFCNFCKEKAKQARTRQEVAQGNHIRALLSGTEGSQTQKSQMQMGAIYRLPAIASPTDFFAALTTSPELSHLCCPTEKKKGRNKMCSTAGEHAILWIAEKNITKRREGAQESKIACASKATIEPL